MKSNAVAVMGYPRRPNEYRFNSNRNLSTGSNNKNQKKKQKE